MLRSSLFVGNRFDDSVIWGNPTEQITESTTVGGVKVDPEDLVDAMAVASLIGINNFRAVHVYRHRYADFPVPVIDRSRCVL
jgi:hypothetical protein